MLEWAKPIWPQAYPAVMAQPTGPFSPRLRQGSLFPPGTGGSPVKSGRPTAEAGEEAVRKHAREEGDPI
jgi:hypothetical protein